MKKVSEVLTLYWRTAKSKPFQNYSSCNGNNILTYCNLSCPSYIFQYTTKFKVFYSVMLTIYHKI